MRGAGRLPRDHGALRCGCVVIPADTLATLLGAHAVDIGPIPRLTVTNTLADALTTIGETLIQRQRALDNHIAESADDALVPYPPLQTPVLLLTQTPPAQHHSRLATTLTLAAPVRISAVVLGQWPASDTLTINGDGYYPPHAGPGAPDLDDAAQGQRIAVLDAPIAVELLHVLREAHTPQAPGGRGLAPPRPIPAASQPRLEPAEPPVPEPAIPGTAATDLGGLSALEASTPEPETHRVRIRLLGQPAILDREGHPVTGLRLHARELLVHLAVHRTGADLSDLMEALWPDATVRRAQERLSTEVANLRRCIRTAAHDTSAQPVINTGGRYHLNPDLLDIDIWTLDDALRTAASTQDPEARAEALRGAIDLHTGVLAELGGLVAHVPLTFALSRRRPVKVEGAAGLRARFGTHPLALVSDIRAIADVCRRDSPHPDLAFVEHIQPISSKTLLAQLNARLDDLLGEPEPSADQLTLAVPESALAHLSYTHAFRVRIGSASPRTVPELHIDDVLRRTRLQSSGHRVDTLRNGWIELLASDDGAQTFGRVPALKWIEATGSLRERRFFLLEGQWYELGVGYYDEVRHDVARLLTHTGPSLDLPAWRAGMHETDFNLHAADVRRNIVCLDRHGVTTRLHKTNGVEICDLLGPNNELIHVKKASGSTPLSHLFAQGKVSAETLINSAEARRAFAELVREEGRGRTIPEDFTPKKIVYAILLKQGEQVTVDTLFPFAQVMLRQTALSLAGKAEVEVIPIPLTT